MSWTAPRPVQRHQSRLRGLSLAVHEWPARATSPQAPPVFCLHGLLDNGAAFAPLVNALARLDRRFLAPDWRGHGDSQWTPGAYWFPEYLADLEACIDHHAPDEPVILLGHSMGGQVASLYAGARPDRVAGVILLDTLNVPDSQPEAAPARYRDWLDTQTRPPEPRRYPDIDALAARVGRRYPELDIDRRQALATLWSRPASPGVTLAADPTHFRRSAYGFRLDEAMALWNEVRAEVVMIDAGASPARHMVDADAMAERRRCFSRCEHIELPGLGHMLHWQAPEQVALPVARALMRF